MTYFGEYLRSARGSQSLQKAADQIGCTKAHLWELEAGRSENPGIKLLAGIARTYCIPLASLAAAWAGGSEAVQLGAKHRDDQAMTLTDERIEELERVAREATPGPWYHRQAGEFHKRDKRPYDWIADDPRPGKHSKIIIDRESLYGGTADYAFIALANPETVLSLLSELKSLRSKAAAYDEMHHRWGASSP